MSWTFHLALSVVAWIPPALPQEAPPKDPQTLIYIPRLGESDMGEETVTRTADGWSTKGQYDYLGMRKGQFEATRNDREWTFSKTVKEIEYKYQFSVKDGKLSTKKLHDGSEKSVDAKGTELPYIDLVWAFWMDIGGALVQDPTPGTTIQLFEPIALTPIPFKLNEVSKIPHDGRELWRFVVGLATVECILVCDPTGLPLRILTPAQRVDVTLKGYESIDVGIEKPVSLVDSGPWRKKLSKAKHDITVETKVMAPMRDDVKLAADIYRPKEGKVPTILVRTPYSRLTEGVLRGGYFARRGYAVVVQDVRGRFDSEGEWFPLKHETQDGYDTIDWIAKQPWSDGNVGMIGGSYVGWVQWYAAK
jgi:hypothetical protein